MQIPKRFKLLGHTITVEDHPQDFYEYNRYGSAHYEGKIIRLVPPSSAVTITQSSYEHTFLHEMLHHCLYHTEQAKLNENEEFVDKLAGLLHQALTTMEYE